LLIFQGFEQVSSSFCWRAVACCDERYIYSAFTFVAVDFSTILFFEPQICFQIW